jgi:hypothetical protein
MATLIVSYAGPAHAVIDPSACKISNLPTPAFWAQHHNDFGGSVASFIQYQVTNGSGTFAGMAYTQEAAGPIIRIIRYSGGKVTVLDTINYINVGTFTPVDSSVRVVGIDPWGNVVARVQIPGPSAYKYAAYRYSPSGQRTKLQDSPTWFSFEPVGVTNTGTVFGTARTGMANQGNDRVVSWTGPGRGSVHVLTGLANVAEAVDAKGDVYYRAGGGDAYVRRASGQVNRVAGVSGNPVYTSFFSAASTSSGYGMSSSGDNVLLGTRWDGAAAKAGDLVDGHRVSNFVWITAVGKNDDVVGQFPGSSVPDTGPRVLVRSTGKAYRLPAQLGSKFDAEPRPAVNGYGQVVYTGSDALAHVLTCPS